MKHKTSELTGAALDWAVATASEEQSPQISYGRICTVAHGHTMHRFFPSTEWQHGGPIIERERIELLYFGTYGCDGKTWEAQIGQDTHYIDQGCCEAMGGETPLIAAMRAYVKHKLGDTVEIPD